MRKPFWGIPPDQETCLGSGERAVQRMGRLNSFFAALFLALFFSNTAIIFNGHGEASVVKKITATTYDKNGKVFTADTMNFNYNEGRLISVVGGDCRPPT